MVAREEKDTVALKYNDNGDDEDNCNIGNFISGSSSNKRRKTTSSDFSVFPNLIGSASDHDDDSDEDAAFIAVIDNRTKCRDEFVRFQMKSIHLKFYDVL